MGRPKDKRDETTWVVFELTYAGEKTAGTPEFEESLRRELGLKPSHDVFVPYLRLGIGNRESVFNVMEGYVFVSFANLDERVCFHAVGDSPYLKSVLSTKTGGVRVLMTVPNSSVEELKRQLSEMVAVEIEKGMDVEIVHGKLMGLKGTVVELDGDNAHVLIQMRTLRTIRTIPRFALLPRGDDVEELGESRLP